MIKLKRINGFPIGIVMSYTKDGDDWLYWKTKHFYPRWLLRFGMFIYRKFFATFYKF